MASGRVACRVDREVQHRTQSQMIGEEFLHANRVVVGNESSRHFDAVDEDSARHSPAARLGDVDLAEIEGDVYERIDFTPIAANRPDEVRLPEVQTVGVPADVAHAQEIVVVGTDLRVARLPPRAGERVERDESPGAVPMG